MTNTVARNGLVYFPEFCGVVLKKFREDDEDQFCQMMFKMVCGTEPFPGSGCKSLSIVSIFMLPRALPRQEVQDPPEVPHQA